jgi:phospholipase C
MRPSPERLLDLPASEAPIDTVVVVMMENRSFDHLLGWLAHDQEYLEQGRKRHGADFHLIGSNHERYRAPDGEVHPTRNVLALETADPLRGCSYRVPGHSWDNGRVQRDKGFLAKGSGNDDFAVTYFDATKFPGHRAVAENFTILDRYHASLLGPTFPNRQYLHSAQSEGRKSDPGPLKTGIYQADTIWDRLAAAGVPATYYYTDLPLLRLWGTRMKPYMAPLDRYFEQAAAGTLPRFSMLEPTFTGDLRADAHPQGNILLAVGFFAHVLDALARSPQWWRSMFILAHDEWGGFYDHVPPPHLPDDRASRHDADDFGQAGFRAAAALISPYAAPNSVDHTVYDHTSIMRFLEWRFLGAPASGPGRDSGKWWLTKRDRFANPRGLVSNGPLVRGRTLPRPPRGDLPPVGAGLSHPLASGAHCICSSIARIASWRALIAWSGRIITLNSMILPSSSQVMRSMPLTYLPAISVSNSRTARLPLITSLT